MSCPRRNILPNGGFQKGLSPWKGRGVRLVANPVRKGDTSLAMKAGSLAYQNISGPFRSNCAYYLYFRVFNNRRTPRPPQLFATVAYLDKNKRLLRSTPVLVEVPSPRDPQFASYFTIVPPPPAATKYLSVIFSVRRGWILVDYVSVTAHNVG
ncbi:hypothetical protein C8P63_12518 [Melghirimyces profundicolus]|uniref:Uncharacterized protein n=1 Tax=Melghirimyces profundicolus TaxID=1242148 RepID=A0A2T6BCV9_9BACL|nr:hypothetical protein [Melghirimyces profundicolus]PTX53900.1 hypothetical protein C8P63_12518 [Melghirimyces profundicolus]